MKISFIVKLFSKNLHHNFDEQGNSDCTPLDGALQTLFYSCFESYFRFNRTILSKKQVCSLLYFGALRLLLISAVIFPPCPGPKLCAFKHAVYFRISNNCFCFFLYASPFLWGPLRSVFVTFPVAFSIFFSFMTMPMTMSMIIELRCDVLFVASRVF